MSLNLVRPSRAKPSADGLVVSVTPESAGASALEAVAVPAVAAA